MFVRVISKRAIRRCFRSHDIIRNLVLHLETFVTIFKCQARTNSVTQRFLHHTVLIIIAQFYAKPDDIWPTLNINTMLMVKHRRQRLWHPVIISSCQNHILFVQIDPVLVGLISFIICTIRVPLINPGSPFGFQILLGIHHIITT